MTTYLTGTKISTQTITWTAPRGDVSLTLIRNARLGVNGYLPAETHEMTLSLAGNGVSFGGLVDHADHGLCISADMGRITVTIPAEHQAAVRALVAELTDNNVGANAARIASDRVYSAHVADVRNMMER